MARPPKINQVVGQRPELDADGVPTGRMVDVTITDQIVADIRAGMYAERAARRAGIHTSTFYDWERRGKAAARRVLAGEITRSRLPAMDRRCLEFSEAVEQAEVEWETRQNAELERIGRGGLEQLETVRKIDAEGKQVEERTKRSRTLPDAAVIQWRLERKFPDRYGRRTRTEHTGADGGPVQVQIQAEHLVHYTRGLLDDLGIAFTDEVRQIAAARLRTLSAAIGTGDDDGPAGQLASVG